MKINSLSNFKYNLSNVGIKSNRQNSYKTAPMPSDSVSFGYFPSRYSHDYEFELYKKTGMDENTQLMLAKTPEETKRILRLAGLDFKYDKDDILSDILKGGEANNSENGGDNYFEIHIEVDELGNDYDVEQVADKVKRLIVDDARYRNNNAINLIR